MASLPRRAVALWRGATWSRKCAPLSAHYAISMPTGYPPCVNNVSTYPLPYPSPPMLMFSLLFQATNLHACITVILILTFLVAAFGEEKCRALTVFVLVRSRSLISYWTFENTLWDPLRSKCSSTDSRCALAGTGHLLRNTCSFQVNLELGFYLRFKNSWLECVERTDAES